MCRQGTLSRTKDISTFSFLTKKKRKELITIDVLHLVLTPYGAAGKQRSFFLL